MKIGITCYPTYGGSGVVATELGLELAARGHDIHFIGGNFQYMSNRGRFITIGGTEKVNAVTIKGKIWGGGPGSTHLNIVDADDLYLPCTIHNRSIAINWGESSPRVHEMPQVLAGEVCGKQPNIRESTP